jgi:succinate dehydrogenase / fumarate reductase, membrane anchor subunit
MSMRSDLGKVRGLGSAKSGTQHFIHQRMSAAALLLLSIFLVASLLRHVGSDYVTMTEWLRQPLVAVLMAALVMVIFWHARLGLQVVIEDYVHDHGNKIAALLLVKFLAALGGLFGLFCILKIAFGA